MFKKLKSILKKLKKLTKPTKKPVKKLVEKTKPIQVKKPPVRKKDAREAYKILKEPHISEKANILTDQNKYVFKIYPGANKIETKKAVENIYKVKVKNVNIINVKKKQKILRGIKGFKSGHKKAIVTLEKGEKIEIIPR